MSGLPLAHGGCTCECHVMPGVKHVAACCFPMSGEKMPPWSPLPPKPAEGESRRRDDSPGTLEHALDEATSAFGTGFWEFKERDHMADAVRKSEWLAAVVAAARAEGAAAEREAWVDFASDLAEHGTRFDLNPTIDRSKVEAAYLSYLARIDKSIRDRAAAAIRARSGDGDPLDT